MLELKHRNIAGHESVDHRSAKPYRPYDRLVLRKPRGRTLWTVLSCEREGKGWNVTAIRCTNDCPTHRRKR